MRSILMGLLLVAGVALYSCGGNSGSTDNTTDSSASTGPSAAPAEESGAGSAAVDVNASSDSKGVGKFTDVKVASTIDQAMAKKGEEVFQTKCTACHQATDQKLIGPGLKGISKIRTPEWIMNMMTNPDEMTQKDPVAKALFEEFNHTQMTNQGVSDEEARQIYEFFRQNDAQ